MRSSQAANSAAVASRALYGQIAAPLSTALRIFMTA